MSSCFLPELGEGEGEEQRQARRSLAAAQLERAVAAALGQDLLRALLLRQLLRRVLLLFLAFLVPHCLFFAFSARKKTDNRGTVLCYFQCFLRFKTFKV